MSVRVIGLGLFVAISVAGCSWFGGPAQEETDTDAVQRAEDPYHTNPKYLQGQFGNYNPKLDDGSDTGLFGRLFGNNDKANDQRGSGVGGPGVSGVGVNSYLWRATLDTVSFLPLASADPFGGVIITDWYSPAETPSERFKVNIYILGRELRADGVRVSVFRQRRDQSGQWADAPVDQATGTDFENAILTRARQMRLSTASK